MTNIDWFFTLKLVHIGALIFWLGPSLGGWLMLLSSRKQLGEHSPATRLAYRIFIRLLIVEHLAFLVLLATGAGMVALVYNLHTPWLQWKILLVLAVILPLEIADMWYGNIKLPRIFAQENYTGYSVHDAQTLHIYHRYITTAAIFIIPIFVTLIMWLVIAKPQLPSLAH